MMKLTVAKVDEALFKGEAASLSCTGALGDVTILPHHAPLVTPLKKGELKIVDNGGKEIRIAMADGILEVGGNVVTVIL
ncbi:MAG: F0F1 ATP synthase subunit epsilon [Candidatus Yonathbacteria bacterium]|nr:F0F1 ATP synthase subunit epsilon [Candidatus Yonathbacteria bacterium]